MTPRERRYHKTRQAILQAARELISEKGVDGFSLREIARRIDYSPAGLYEYFDNRDEILLAVCAEGMDRFREALQAVPADLPPDRRLTELGRAYLRFANEFPEHFILIFTSLPQHLVALTDLTQEGSLFNTLLDAVREGLTAGVLPYPPESNPLDVAYALWAQVHGMAMLQQTHLQSLSAELDAVHERVLTQMSKTDKPLTN